ncbi:MAG: sirohydrochlorin cobaltochelatase [Mangrovibacterium sp.]|nr:sirohydrochlorin cobaltochelatase [Mangrovibacterium sp.]
MTAHKSTGILLVAFGSVYSGARAAVENIEREVKKAFPEAELFWAFTSSIIRSKLKREGRPIDSPAEALMRMRDNGFGEIIVQLLHVIPGGEYESLQKKVKEFIREPGGVQTVRLGKPLLYSHEDIVEVCRILPDILPAGGNTGDVVILMGHGTSHPSNIYYPGIQYYLWQQSPFYWIATIEGYPGLHDVLPMLRELKFKRIWLVPFLAIAGNHVLNDMAGDKPDSWKSLLESEDYEVHTLYKGLAEYNEIVRIWIRHLEEILFCK